MRTNIYKYTNIIMYDGTCQLISSEIQNANKYTFVLKLMTD